MSFICVAILPQLGLPVACVATLSLQETGGGTEET
jgi:hypothetical protein